MKPQIIKVGLKMERPRGYFKLEIKHADGTVDTYGGDGDKGIPNLIVNQGLDALGNTTSGYTVFGCGVGTSNVAPAATDTTMPDLIAGLYQQPEVSTVFQVTTSPYTSTNTWVYTYAQGAVVGNVSKVAVFTEGLSTPTTTSKLFSAALTMSGGVPVTIPVTYSDQVTLTYTLVLRIPTGAQTGSFNININGTETPFTYSATACAAEVGSGNWVIGSVTGFGFTNNNFVADANIYDTTVTVPGPGSFPTADTSAAGSLTTGAYTTGSYSVQYTATWSISENVTGNVGAFGFFGSLWAYCVTVSPSIAKTNSDQLVIIFSVSWSN